MMVFVFLLGAFTFLVGAVLTLRARSGIPVIVRLLRRPTLTVARLHEGAVEISGRVMPAGEPLVSLSGHRCVAVTRTVTGYSGVHSKSSTTTGKTTARHVVPARVTDATGECRLDLDLSEVIGESWTARIEAGGFSSLPPNLVPAGSEWVEIEEVIVPEGAMVLASGDATETPLRPGGHRNGRASEWVLSGNAEQLLLLTVGGQASLIARTVGMITVVFAMGACVTSMGALMMLLAVG